MSSTQWTSCLLLPLLAACGGAQPAPPPNTKASPELHQQAPPAAAKPPVAEVAATPTEIVPARVRNAYPSKSDLGKVKSSRSAEGWSLELLAPPSPSPDRSEWAGFCWDISPINATRYDQVVLHLPEVQEPTEVEVKLERQNNTVQDVVLQYLQEEPMEIDLTNYERVRDAIARVCIMALGKPTATAPNSAKFKVATVTLK